MKIKLKNRHIEILRCLITAGIPLDISDMSKRFGKSERTIHNDLNTIRDYICEYGIEIRNKSKKGFYIPAAQKPKCSQVLTEKIEIEEYSLLDEVTENRYHTLFLYFICQKEAVSLNDVADSFYVSKSTAQRVINKFNQYFNQKVQLVAQRTGGYKIAGDELEMRRTAQTILVDLFNGSYTNEDWYLLLPDAMKKEIKLQNIVDISNAIKKVNAYYNVWISNHAFLNLLSYCITRDIRVYKKCLMAMEKNPLENFKHSGEYEYAVLLLKELKTGPSELQESELIWLLSILNGNGVFVNHNDNIEKELESVISQMVEMLSKIGLDMSYDFDIATLTNDLYEHMQRYLKMDYKENDSIEHLLLSEVHNKYEDFYILAEKCVTVFEKHYDMCMPKLEICYIAIYLYKNLIQHSFANKRVLVVCATGKGLSSLLTTRIKNVFHNLTVVNQVSPFQIDSKYLPENIDFIISTVPITNCFLPVVKISTILSREDIQRIQEFMDYGEFIDSIPFHQDNSASFSSKADPFDLFEVAIDTKKTDLSSVSIIFSKLIMTLLEYLSKLPKNYQMNPDNLLGITIHMSMALPRWCSKQQPEDSQESIDEYYKLREIHNSVFVLMEKFFHLVEDVLLISIPISERYSFFLYIINNEEVKNEKCFD